MTMATYANDTKVPNLAPKVCNSCMVNMAYTHEATYGGETKRYERCDNCGAASYPFYVPVPNAPAGFGY